MFFKHQVQNHKIMNTVVLIGTRHSIQLGERSPDLFKNVLREQCQNHNVKGVAEEINQGDTTIASALAAELYLPHLYADPDTKERIERDIPNNISIDLVIEYGDRFPNICNWPKTPSSENLPQEVWNEYSKRTHNAYRMREKIWLEKILYFDKWPLLFICGEKHFLEFSKLLKQNGVRVVEASEDWKAIEEGRI